MKSAFKPLAYALVAAALCVSAPVRADQAADTISARQANYKRIGDIAEALKKAVDAGTPVLTLVSLTGELDQRVHKIPDFFPAGTGPESGAKTKAKPDIWTDRAAFDKLAANIGIQADKLDAVAKTGDNAAFAEQFKATGAACGACHRQFRER